MVIDAKRRAYQDKPELEKIEALTRQQWIRSAGKPQIPESQVKDAEIRYLVKLMFKQGQEDHDPFYKLAVKR